MVEGVDGLLVRAGAGDPDAFAALYDVTCTVAFQLARCLDPSHAEQLLLDSYVEAWRRASQFDPSRERSLTWVLAIVRDCAMTSRPPAVA